MDQKSLDGPVKIEGSKSEVPMFRPGFGELTGKEVDGMKAKNKKFSDMLSSKKKVSFKESEGELVDAKASPTMEQTLDNIEKNIDQ